jgi:hypothetical protein
MCVEQAPQWTMPQPYFGAGHSNAVTQLPQATPTGAALAHRGIERRGGAATGYLARKPEPAPTTSVDLSVAVR